MRLVAAVLFCLPLSAQITAISSVPVASWTVTGSSPTITVSTHERQHGFEVNELKVTLTGTYQPGTTTITPSGIGALSLALCVAGTGATGCGPWSSSPSNSNHLTSGSNCGSVNCVNPELFIGFDGYTDDGYGPANFSATTCAAGGTTSDNAVHCTYTGTVTITGGFTINVTLVIDKLQAVTVTYPGGSCSGTCVNSESVYPDPDEVTPTNMVPPGSCPGAGCPATSAGGTYTDPNFGGVVYTVIPPLTIGVDPTHTVYNCFDAVATPFNADGTLMFGCRTDGTINVYSTTPPFTIQWTYAQLSGIGPGASQRWSGVDPKAIFYTSGSTVHKAILGTPGASPTCDQAIFTAGAALQDGGDSEVSKDDWYATVDTTNTLAYVINLNGSGCSFTATSYSINYSGLANGFAYRNANISNVDVVTGKRYMILQSPAGGGTRGNERYSIPGAGGTITDDGPFPVSPGQAQQLVAIGGTQNPVFTGDGSCNSAAQSSGGYCQGTGHMATCEIGGRQGFCGAQYGRTHPSRALVFFESFAVPVNLMATDVAAGGGATIIAVFDHNAQDTHFSAARQGNVMVITGDSVTGATPGPAESSWKITNVTNNGGVCHITSDIAYTGANADVLSISNLNGACTALNGAGLCTVANLSGTTLDCSGSTFSGSYTANTGVFYKNVALQGPPKPHAYENQVYYVPTLSSTPILLRHSINRSFWTNRNYLMNAPNPYYDQAHGSTAQNGTKFSFQGHYGVIDRDGVYLGLTGFSSSGNTKMTGQRKNPTGNTKAQ